MEGHIFSSPKRARLLVYGEILILLLAIIQLYKIFGMQLKENGIELFAVPILPQNWLWLIATILVFLIVYFGIARKDRLVMKIHKDFSKVVLGTGKQKIFGMDKEVSVLLFVEFTFAIMLAVAIYIYLDPEVNLVPWPWNYITFFIVLIVGLYFFSQTKQFRETIYGESKLKKISPAKRLFPTRRITNTKTGLIRISHKRKKNWKKSETKHRKRIAKRTGKKLKKMKK